MLFDINFDGLGGPTYTFSGLSYGNIASLENQNAPSNPRAAALQGLEKMWFLTSLGFPQGILLPHERPHMPTLRSLGYKGDDAHILNRVAQEAPELLLEISSSSHLWAANAATISPSVDTVDQLVHITTANLNNKFHRSIEAPMTAKILQTIFADPAYFMHHDPLLGSSYFSDEGAANFMRLSDSSGSGGVEVFIFGRYSLKNNLYTTKTFPARQTFEASAAIARLHQIKPQQMHFIQQNPQAIDSGVFHNDVIAFCHRQVLCYHEDAYLDSDNQLAELAKKLEGVSNTTPCLIKVTTKDVPLEVAVKTYLFNSQLLTLPQGGMALIAPIECQQEPMVQDYLEKLLHDPHNPIAEIHFLDVRESMRNGGGPACLRLHAELTEKELLAIDQTFILTEKLYLRLKAWIEKHYRDRLTPNDLSDPQLLNDTYTALDALTKLLNLGAFYSFQT